jgi:hypothetical protein
VRRLLPALLLAPFLLAGCGGESDWSAVLGREFSLTGRTATVLVPAGALEVTVGEPVSGDLDEERTNDLEGHRPPDGATYLPVLVEHDPIADLPVTVLGQPLRPTRLVVRSGGHAVELPAAYRLVGPGTVSGGFLESYVPVEDPDDVTLEATYDGLTQVLDVATGEVEAGAAEPLYDGPGGPTPLECGPVPAWLECELSVERVPYLPGTGWASAGRAFAVLAYEVHADGEGDPRIVVTVDGAGPVGGSGQRPVFEVAATGGQASLEVSVDTDLGVREHTVTVDLP